MKYLLNILMLALPFTVSADASLKEIKELRRLAFGSCNKHTRPQPIWDQIAANSPDLFIFDGDTVYADGKGLEVLSNAYKIQNNVEAYKKFKTVVPVIGMWDDHDYGKNNGGNEYQFKKESQKLFLDFIGEPLNSPRRNQEGVYTSYTFGKDDHKVKVILLDNRYFKNIEKGALLGEKQWKWFEEEIKNSDASLNIIVAGISILSPKTIHSEEWADYPAEKERLAKTVKSTKTPYLYLAGDKHFADIFWKNEELEFLSSGMTHNTEGVVRPLIRAMYPSPIFRHNYGLIDFQWEGKTPVLDLSVRTDTGEVFNQKKVKWNNGRWIIL